MTAETGTSLSNLLGKPAAAGRKLKSFVGLIHHLFDHKAAEIGANILIAVIWMPFDLTDPAPGLLFHLNIMIALVVLEQNVEMCIRDRDRYILCIRRQIFVSPSGLRVNGR